MKDELEYCTDGISVCPDNWEFINSTGMCRAPIDYNGFCDKLMDFSSFTDEAKIDWASSCDVNGRLFRFIGKVVVSRERIVNKCKRKIG